MTIFKKCRVIHREKAWLENGLSLTLSPTFLLAQAIFEPRLFHMNNLHFLNIVILHLSDYGDETDSVPKRRHIKFRRWGITQKKVYNTVLKLESSCKY